MTKYGTRRADITHCLNSRVQQIFPEGDIYFVTDDQWLGIAATYYGLRAMAVEDIGKLPQASSVVLFLRKRPVNADLWRMLRLRESRVLLIPVTAFDSSLVAALYTQRLAMITDYAATRRMYRGLMKCVEKAAGPLTLDNGDDVAITVLDALLVHDVLVDDLPVGGDRSSVAPIAAGQEIEIGSYCQVTLTPRAAGQRAAGPRAAAQPSTPFHIEGTAYASAVLIRHKTERGSGLPPDIEAAHRFLATHCPIMLDIRDGVVASLRMGVRAASETGGELADIAHAAIGPRGSASDLYVREVSLGANDAIRPHVNWNINSPLHVGAGTVCITVGADGTDRQIDFIMAPTPKTQRVQAVPGTIRTERGLTWA
jgi:hypothetical protein